MNERSFFGTDGIRGRANEPPLTVDFALLVGKAAATLAWEGRGESKEGRKPRILLGRDTRLSGQALVSAIAAGATSSGADVFELGVLPTPAVALLANSMRADLAIVVTASHNPFEDNGIKFFNNEGRKLSDELEARIEVFLRGEEKPCRVSAAKMGRMYDLSSASDRYVEIILRTFPREKSLEDLRVVLDCANGAASRTSPQILEELGANLTVLNARPDGTNINRKCGSNFPEVLAHEVCRLQADVGIAHDGDADRVVLVDEKGTVLDGDEILAIAALNMIERGKLPGNSIVATVMSNFGLDELLERYGGKVWRTNVGDRFVAEEMFARGIMLGGEQSGHILFREFSPTGDGILTALQILRIMIEKGESLSSLRKCLIKFPQVRRDIPVVSRPAFETVPEITTIINKIEKELSDKGRVLLRYSGTENLARLLVEGRDKDRIESYANEIAAIVGRCLGGGRGDF